MLLRNLFLNCQDLYVFLDKFTGESIEDINPQHWQLQTTSFYNNKDLSKLFEIAELVKTKDPHVLSLVEVGGKESLDNFNKYFLDSQYTVFHHPSNSDRGIDLGFLVKNELADRCTLSHQNKARLDNGKKFSRGLLKLELKTHGHQVMFYLCHLKSKLDLKKEDFEGRSQRSSEVNYIVKDILELQKSSKDVLIAMQGDLNGIIYKDETEQELLAFEKNGLIDLMEQEKVELLDRTSYTYFKRNGDRFCMQLDYILGNTKLRERSQNSYICDFSGNASPILPKSLKERWKIPSDHFPYYFEISLN